MNTRIMQNEEEILGLTKSKEEIELEKKEKAEKLDADIASYKKNIDQLQQEFTKMLGETLAKIKAKIELANKQWEEENDTKMIRGFEETVKNTALGQ